MKSPIRPSGEPRSTTTTTTTTTTTAASPAAASSPTAAAAPARPASSTDAVRVGVAGRRDYPASTRRDHANGSDRTDGATVTSVTVGSSPKTGEKPAAEVQSAGHIAEQRIDSDRPRPDSGSIQGVGKERARRATGKSVKADRAKPVKPAAAEASVPGARLSAYAEEAAELLAGLSPDHRRRKPGATPDAAKDARSTRQEPAKD
jgi:hypothetical protein